MRFIFWLSGLLLGASLTYAQGLVRSENKEYAGQQMKFYHRADPVTPEKLPAFVLDFDASGKSRASVNFKQAVTVFCDFGIYRGMLLVEPNTTIELKLPPLREKSFADEKNPYFTPLSFWFATNNHTQTNSLIADFDVELNRLTDHYFNQLFFRQSRKIYDSIVYFLDQKFDDAVSADFRFHRKMKLKMVEAEAFRLRAENYASVFSGVESTLWLRPSFIDLFDKAFGGQLSFEAKTLEGAEIRKAVEAANVSALLQRVKTKYRMNDDMTKLALLKMLHDAFYSGDFSKTAIQKMVESEQFTRAQNNLLKTTAQNIAKKLTHLQQGTAAPPICLKSPDGDAICTNHNTTKFKYLVFADTDLGVCREQLKNIKPLLDKFGKHLEIFVVLRKTNALAMKKYLAENKIGGVKLVDETGKFIEEYNVKSYPQCFLLDENHRIKFDAAKAPMDGFEQQFGAFLQRELFERQRK